MKIRVVYRKSTTNRIVETTGVRVIMRPLDLAIYGPTFAVQPVADSPRLEVFHGVVEKVELLVEQPTQG